MKTLVDKIITHFRLILILVLSTLMLFTAMTLNMILLPDLFSVSEDILQSKNHEISAYLNANINEIESMVQLIDEEDDLKENLDKLRKFASIENNFESLGIVDTEGMIHVTTGAVFSIENRDYYQQIKNGDRNTVLSDPVVSRDDQIPIVLILTKIHDEQHHLKGYLSSAISLVTIEEILNQSNTFDFETRILLSGEPDPILSSGKVHKHYKEVRQPLLAHPEWTLSLCIPSDFFVGKILVTCMILFVLFLILLVTGNYIAKKTMKHCMKPLEELTESISKAPDSLDEITVCSDTVEIQELTDSTNRMMERIRNLITEIEETEKEKNESEYKALIQQIKPHFLYNTLEMIQSFCLDFEDDRAEKAIGLLARFFRISLSNDALFIPLSRELQQIESYVRIQQLRYENKFEFHIDNQLQEDPLFLHFSLQPIIENAIYHGIKKQSAPGCITVVCEKIEEEIRITVSNTAENVDKEKIERLNRLFQNSDDASQYPGYGLYNVRQRLKLYFKEQASIQIACDKGKVWVTMTHPAVKGESNEHIGN